MRLRQVCCDARLCAEALPPGHILPDETPKLDALVALLTKALDEGRTILVFSQFAEMVRLISDRLSREGIQHASMTGQTIGSQTIEDRILVAQQAKKQLAHSLLDDGTLIADERKLSDLMDLFSAPT
ncbi:SNF2-related:helicase [mine drainage metagenome]|uniref:SNF2-related:helicase n=1 Tax=mine drainage metagenome TaxID=410659 RepID=T0Z8V3_9ZZZZ